LVLLGTGWQGVFVGIVFYHVRKEFAKDEAFQKFIPDG